MGGMKRSYKVIRKGMIRDARWQTKLVQKPYNSKHKNSLSWLDIGDQKPKTVFQFQDLHWSSPSLPALVQISLSNIPIGQLNRLVSPMSSYEFSNVPIICYRTSIGLSNIQFFRLWPQLWVAVLGVGAVWTWWRGQPGIRDLYLWIKVSANPCHHHHRHHDHHFQRSYLQNWQKKGNAVLSGYVVSFICVSN